ncbi:MAG TPA: hypothetical protein VKO18_22080 [Terriglobia bacterium]|nr:hypothetical protein [Terriglobia bacterium]
MKGPFRVLMIGAALCCLPAASFSQGGRNTYVIAYAQRPEKGDWSDALECGSLLPLCCQPACWRRIALSGEIPASKLAGWKAAASCRTPKLRTP